MKVKQYVEPHPQPYAFINAYVNKEKMLKMNVFNTHLQKSGKKATKRKRKPKKDKR